MRPPRDDEALRAAFVGMQVNADFSEAVLWMKDGGRLCFRHRVDERWAKAVPTPEGAPGLAESLLARIGRFRLNAKHLDIEFADGSRWETVFPGRK